MKISILMPTYNCPVDLLYASVSSVLAQSHKDVEIMIKDGCVESPAINDPMIFDLFSSERDRIKYTLSPDGPPPDQSGHFKHNGFYQALNWCVENSTGEVLSLLCSDDERGDSETLAYVNGVFEEAIVRGEPTFLYGACEWINREGQTVDIKVPPVPITFDSLLKDYMLYTPSLYWNREVHKRFGLFDYENYKWCADLDFWLRCWKGLWTRSTPRIIGKYRVWGTSQSRENSDLMGPESLSIQRKHRNA